jgi:hypothetical protein
MKPKYKLGDKVWVLRPCYEVAGVPKSELDEMPYEVGEIRFAWLSTGAVYFRYNLVQGGVTKLYGEFEANVFDSPGAAQAECARRNKEGGHLK